MHDYRDTQVLASQLPRRAPRGSRSCFTNSSPQQIDALECWDRLLSENLASLRGRGLSTAAGSLLLRAVGYSHTCSGTSSEPMNAILGFIRKAGQKPPPPLPPLRRTMDDLQIVAEDTISRTPEIIAATPGASADSIFHTRQLPPLNKDACPNFPQFAVRIEDLDAFTTARNYIRQDPTIRGKLAVLNLASDQYRAGGWRRTLCKTQVRRIPSLAFLRLV